MTRTHWLALAVLVALALLSPRAQQEEPKKGGDLPPPKFVGPSTLNLNPEYVVRPVWGNDWQDALTKAEQRNQPLLTMVTNNPPPYWEHRGYQVVHLYPNTKSTTPRDPTLKTYAQRFQAAGFQPPCYILFQGVRNGVPQDPVTLNPTKPLPNQTEELLP